MSKRTGQRILITAKQMAKWESVMAKLDNEIAKEKEEARKKSDGDDNDKNS